MASFYKLPTKPRGYDWPVLPIIPTTGGRTDHGATPEQLQSFAEQGFFIARNFVDSETCNSMLERAQLLPEAVAAGTKLGHAQLTRAADRTDVIAGLDPWQSTSKVILQAVAVQAVAVQAPSHFVCMCADF
jgi:hypothetical protein